MWVVKQRAPGDPTKDTPGARPKESEPPMIVETTIQDRQIVAYIDGYIERYVETHGYEPHQDDIDEVTQEAIKLYS